MSTRITGFRLVVSKGAWSFEQEGDFRTTGPGSEQTLLVMLTGMEAGMQAVGFDVDVTVTRSAVERL